MSPNNVESGTTDDTEVVGQQQRHSPIHDIALQIQTQAPVETHGLYQTNDVHTRPMGMAVIDAILPPQNPSSLMSFKEAVVSNARRIPLKTLVTLLLVCVGIMDHLAKELSIQFLLELINSHAATQAPLSLGEAFQGFRTVIAYEMAIMLVFLLALLLSCPQPLCGMVMVTISFLGLFVHIPDLVGKAPGIAVTSGFFRMPLICFTTIVAFVLTLVFVFLAVFFAYLTYGCARGAGISTGGELEVAMQDSLGNVEEGGVN
ncbi:hypothetical protein GLYMA_18G245400v4 [Glycine max]|uniref:Uncharacterized protein n=1 Tax=Glycine max TaxID=3847 RepID=K7MUI6_SOYBN|nr:uncharacterized protein LOC100799163 [Glycine max]XP_006602850.1 uncharacterized protein LOC100799163 [Glycine max]KAH1155994.1 hypothetical protein GYH30_051005 [Glycine max]KRH00970.1 hypothetical protein GLYMA_18G245400v4 [Glycine max]|eukprot:XP_003552464.1 uncharacterized protein LOC100799163 [Glycine max]